MSDGTRNVGTPRGRPVTVDDVRPYVLPKHGRCRGKGVVGAVACKCAQKRFMKAHPEVIVDFEGKLLRSWWPAEVEE